MRPTLVKEQSGSGPSETGSKLAAFILAERESIMREWEAFARTCAPASGVMDIAELRDHASEMLTIIAKDLNTAQTKGEQSEKSKGNAPEEGQAKEKTAAEEHGAERAESGFTLQQMVSEYRALRASVLRLWTESKGEMTPADLPDVTRFNEAIDQSLGESVTRYTQDMQNSKEMFLAVLGHDLRSPLSAITTSSKFMLETGDLKEPHLTLTARIASSSGRMNRLIGDLLDFTRSRLGDGIPVKREPMNMETLVREVVEEIGAAHPNRAIRVTSHGTLNGEWDCARISQVLTNLIGNAIDHGSDKTAIGVDLHGDDREIRIAIHNHGPPIPAEQLNGIFNPMKRSALTGGTSSSPTANLGLGLYIADRIVNAHQGTIDLKSSETGGTTFTVHLPRRAGQMQSSNRSSDRTK